MIALDAESSRLEWERKGVPWRIGNITAATIGPNRFGQRLGNA
jgi:hypothetical protein